MQEKNKPPTAHDLLRDAKLAQALRSNLRRRKAADRPLPSPDDPAADDKRS